ncbi:hypothetical protein [Devriesea agamarum]|uniref:hypothetical protein n=1 Tax=Devriesea agamarum TaxID=472569 RepID=UPI0012ECF09A|nr:hypothetical protein [Devriesea agamarum]
MEHLDSGRGALAFDVQLAPRPAFSRRILGDVLGDVLDGILSAKALVRGLGQEP